jgi:hypothetical protein
MRNRLFLRMFKKLLTGASPRVRLPRSAIGALMKTGR